jgi:hypothetical protein
MKKCRHCGFENPDSANRCLSCGSSDLPASVPDLAETKEMLRDLTSGDVGGAAGRITRGIVQGEVEEAKLRLNPLWWLRVRLFRLKQSVIGCLAILLIVALCVVVGLAADVLKRFFGG